MRRPPPRPPSGSSRRRRPPEPLTWPQRHQHPASVSGPSSGNLYPRQCVIFSKDREMKAMAFLLVAAVLSTSGALGAGLTQVGPRHVPSAVEVALPPSVTREPRWDVAANFDKGPMPVPPDLK